jgi:uncharacterized membrane protein
MLPSGVHGSLRYQVVFEAELRRSMTQNILVPIVLIVLAVPLILEKIPRNGFYGFRTPYTFSSDDVWYRANKIAGISLLVAGVFWLSLGVSLPQVMASQQEAMKLARNYGLAGLALSVAVSFWLVYRTR